MSKDQELINQLQNKIKNLENELERSHNAFFNIIGKNRDGILIFNYSGEVIYANPAALDLFGKNLGELLGENIGILIENDKKTEITIIHKDRGRIFVEINIANTTWNDKPAQLASLRDISEHKKTKTVLERLSHFDYLTDLSNRVYFEEALKTSIARADRRQEKIALFFLDMDGFKKVNDIYGHQVGDKLLVYVAALLKSCVRSEDVVSRIGGDEFAIIINSASEISYYEKVANRILRKIKKLILIDENQIRVNFSIGVSIFPDTAKSADDLIKIADSSMYFCKKSGKGRYHIAPFIDS